MSEPRTLFVHEIFKSISGEVGGFPQGSECVFVRMAGCNLRCDFCDAPDSQIASTGNVGIDVDELMENIMKFNCSRVVITGGEPFIQDEFAMFGLINRLKMLGFTISIETNGTKPIHFDILAKSTIVMDFKMNYLDKMRTRHFLALKSTDFIKFVVGNDMTMALALNIHKKLYLQGCAANFAYSPMLLSETPEGLIREATLKSKMITNALGKTKLTGILNLQIHKLISQR